MSKLPAPEDRQEALRATIFFPFEAATSADGGGDSAADSSSRRQILQTTATALNAFIEEVCTAPLPHGANGYIWNRDVLRVQVPKESGAGVRAQRTAAQYGQLSVYQRTGGALEDVHFSTYLLRQATVRFASLGLAVAVEDEDGQFLLIDAADHLDDWVTPDNAEGRVWIYNGRLHIVSPQAEASARNDFGYGDDGLRIIKKGKAKATEADLRESAVVDEEDVGALPPALGQAIVRDPALDTLAPSAVESAAFAVLADFPLTAHDQLHTALAYLPLPASRALQREPQLITRAVEALLSRDTLSVRAAQRMARFLNSATPCLNAPGEQSTATASAAGAKVAPRVILSPVRMTKRAYAALITEHYLPPKVFGREWQAAVEEHHAAHFRKPGEARPTEQELKGRSEEQERRGAWLDLGAKVCCGLEMLYAESKARGGASRLRSGWSADSKMAAGDDDADAHSAARAKFIASLRSMGYFGSETQGSARWQELESSALREWERQQAQKASDKADEQEAASALDGIAVRIDQYLASDDAIDGSLDPPDFSAEPLSKLKAREDDTSWLDVERPRNADGEEDFVPTAEMDEDEAERYAAKQLEALSSKMDDFLGGDADHRGARFADEPFADGDSEEDSGSDVGSASHAEDMEGVENDATKADAEAKAEARKRLQDMSSEQRSDAMKDLVKGIEPGTWGAAAKLAQNRAARETSDAAAEDSAAPLAEMKVVDGDTGEVKTTSALDPLSAAELAALFPGPQGVEPMMKWPTSNGAADATEAHAEAVAEPTAAKRKDMGAQVKGLRSSLRQRSHLDGDSDSEESLLDAKEAGDSEMDRSNRAQWLDLDADGSDVEHDEADVDMDDEMDDFVKFATEALGLSREQYDAIISEREARGAFVPGRQKAPASPHKEPQAAASAAPEAAKANNARSAPAEDRQARPYKTFEEVMDAMDQELARAKTGTPQGPGIARTTIPTKRAQADPETQSKRAAPSASAPPQDAEADSDSDDELTAQDQELIRMLVGSGTDLAGINGETDAPMLQLNMIKNFLESYKAQGGSAGPVSSLAGRMNIGPLPSDADA